MQLQLLLCFLFCLAANWTDHCTLRIPNKIILWSAAAGLVVQIFLYGWTGVLQWAGGLLPAFVLLPFFALRMLGAGDIKLLSTLGGDFRNQVGCTFDRIFVAIIWLNRNYYSDSIWYFCAAISRFRRIFSILHPVKNHIIL